MKEVTITVTVDDKGETVIEANGFKDGACLKETKSIEEALGKVAERTTKSEACMPPIADRTKVTTGS